MLTIGGDALISTARFRVSTTRGLSFVGGRTTLVNEAKRKLVDIGGFGVDRSGNAFVIDGVNEKDALQYFLEVRQGGVPFSRELISARIDTSGKGKIRRRLQTLYRLRVTESAIVLTDSVTPDRPVFWDDVSVKSATLDDDGVEFTNARINGGLFDKLSRVRWNSRTRKLGVDSLPFAIGVGESLILNQRGQAAIVWSGLRTRRDSMTLNITLLPRSKGADAVTIPLAIQRTSRYLQWITSIATATGHVVAWIDEAESGSGTLNAVGLSRSGQESWRIIDPSVFASPRLVSAFADNDVWGLLIVDDVGNSVSMLYGEGDAAPKVLPLLNASIFGTPAVDLAGRKHGRLIFSRNAVGPNLPTLRSATWEVRC